MFDRDMEGSAGEEALRERRAAVERELGAAASEVRCSARVDLPPPLP